jgi:hypothetical protein
MIDSDIHLRLLANEPIDVGIGHFQLPTVREIIRMGESKHQQYLSMLLFNKDYLQANNQDIAEYSDLEVLATSIFYDPIFRELVANSFKLFLGKDLQVTDNGIIYFDELSEDNVLTEEKWGFIKKVAKIGNFVQEEKKEEEYTAGNERARKFLEEQKKRKALLAKLKKTKEQTNLHSILSAVAWRTTGMKDLLNLTIYQLYDGYFRLGMIDNYNQITTGIYTGNVDSSKIKLPDINWANIIKIN